MNKLGLESSFHVKLNLRSLVSNDQNQKPVARAPYIEHDAIQQLSHRRCPAGKLYILVSYDYDHVKMQRDQDPTTAHLYMSLVMRKPSFCICENKDADQLRGNREADQRLCFLYTDSTIPLLPMYEISSL